MERTPVIAFAILVGTVAFAQSQDRNRSDYSSQAVRIARGDAEQMPYGDTRQQADQKKAMANYRTPANGRASTNGGARIKAMDNQHGRTQIGYRHFRRMCGWHHGQRACYRSTR